MRVTTTIILPSPPDLVWPLLCTSRMDPHIPFWFRVGIPKPTECRLPNGPGAAGGRRECVSDRGVVHQRITVWEPPRRLCFQMEDTTLYFRSCVTSLREEFVLDPHGADATRITRTTNIAVSGWLPSAKALIMCAGMKCVHRHVFTNWSRLLVAPQG